MKELAEGSGAEGRRQEHHRLRCIHRPRRRRRPAPHHRHVVGPHLASVRDGADRRRSSRSRFSTSTGSASASRSASSSSRAIRGRTSPRSIRSARACQGKVVSITNYGAFIELEPGIEGLVHISEMSWTRNVRHPSKLVSHRRDDRGGGAQGRSERGEDLARHEADGAGSVDGAAAQVSGRHAHQRQGSQPHELRRVRRDRAGHRRTDSHLRHVLDQARAASVGSREEGRRGRRRDPQHRRREQAHLARAQAGARKIRGSRSARPIRSAPSSRAASCA